MNKGSKRSMRIEEVRLVPKPCPWARLGRARCPNGARGRALGALLRWTLCSYVFWLVFTWYKSWNLGHSKGRGKTQKNTHLGHILESWRAWRSLGKLGIQVGSLERFELSSFVVVYLLPSSSYLFNELLHSFRVCFIYIYV